MAIASTVFAWPWFALPTRRMPESTSRCVVSTWSAPELLGARNAVPRVARFGDIVESPRRTFVIGNNIPRLAAPLRPESLLTIAASDGKEVGRPDGDFVFVYPKGSIDTDGALHLIWAEPMHRPREFHILGLKLGSIWSSAYRDDRGWSTPIRLHEGPVFWSKAVNDRIAVHNRDAVIGTGWVGAFVVLHFDGAAWHARATESWHGGAFSSMEVRNGTLYHAYLGVVPPGRDRNSVLFTRSTDGGRTWESPTVIRRSGLDAAYDVRLRFADDGILHLFWRQPGENGQVYRLIRSRDGGMTWSPPDDLVLPNGANAPQIEVDRCGRVHVVFEHPTAQPERHLDHAIWDGSWSPPTHLFPELRAGDVALERLSDGVLMLTTTAQPAGSSIETDARTYVSRLKT